MWTMDPRFLIKQGGGGVAPLSEVGSLGRWQVENESP